MNPGQTSNTYRATTHFISSNTSCSMQVCLNLIFVCVNLPKVWIACNLLDHMSLYQFINPIYLYTPFFFWVIHVHCSPEFLFKLPYPFAINPKPIYSNLFWTKKNSYVFHFSPFYFNLIIPPRSIKWSDRSQVVKNIKSQIYTCIKFEHWECY